MWDGLRDKIAEGYGALLGGDDTTDDATWNAHTERRLKLLLRHLKTLKVASCDIALIKLISLTART